MVLAVIVASLTMSLLVIVLFNLGRGPERLPQQIIRFLLTAGLCVFLYRGANWARWVGGVLFALGALGSLLGGLALLSTSIAGVLLLVMCLVYSASAVILLFVPTVRAYFGVDSARAD